MTQILLVTVNCTVITCFFDFKVHSKTKCALLSFYFDNGFDTFSILNTVIDLVIDILSTAVKF